MTTKFETQNKFIHLWDIPPNINSILALDLSSIWKKHLFVLDKHFAGLLEQFPELAKEILNIREKIANIANLKVDIKQEVIQASNNSWYYEINKEVA